MKSVGVAYLLWFFGMHRFYLGRPLTALLYLMTCGGFGVWFLVDLLLIPTMVAEENAAFAELFRGDVNVTVRNSKHRRKTKR
jgi:TM2 domain-containing membrane protein YozV